MKLNQVEATFICQLSKPQNKAMLERYRDHKDKSLIELMNYYGDIIKALINTPAWGVSGVNKMVNDLTDQVRATFNKEKKGKTSAYAHAGAMLRYIEFFGEQTATPRYCGRHKLMPLITEEEFQQFLA